MMQVPQTYNAILYLLLRYFRQKCKHVVYFLQEVLVV